MKAAAISQKRLTKLSGTVIGNHRRSIYFRWPWVTFEGHLGDLLTVVTLCSQLTRDLLATAKFLVMIRLRKHP